MKWNNHMLLYSKLVVAAVAVLLLVFVSAIAAVAVVADEMKEQLEASN